MKCIEYIDTELIKRVKNGVADEAVKKGEAIYVSKQTWKEKVRDANRGGESDKSDKGTKAKGKKRTTKRKVAK